jgi:hypothetical protein
VRFHTQLVESFCQTNVGAIFDTLELLDLHKEEFSQFYLHDFVRMVHKCTHKKRDMEELEYEVQVMCGIQQIYNNDNFFAYSLLSILSML